MFSIKRNQAIITLLVFMIFVAAYIDSQDRQTTANLGQEENEAVQVGQNTVEEDDLFGDYEVVAEEPFENIEDSTEEVAQLENDPYNFVATIAKKEDITEQQFNGGTDVIDEINESPFANRRLDRANYRALQTGNFKSYIKDESYSQEIRDGYAKKLLNLEEMIQKEDSIEREMAGAGYQNSFADIGENSVQITIDKESFEDNDVAKIEDIAMRITKMEASQIHISPFSTIQDN